MPDIPPPRRLKGWRWKGNNREVMMGLPPRDISLAEANKEPRWLALLNEPSTNRYYQAEYTNPSKGEH